ncbi:unnamed protein product [Plasmodium vivax]|uniref:E3 ubiquitin protein ligase n=1 Tax=Plasmodium vivax TaxID=5855 RepID=A0A8S4HDF3_PLAVI|nr:unnamed protein product [Plasmodium vivax]
MNSKKRNRSGKSECITLPLEKTELLIENIYNLRNAISLYRKELQEKNKCISDVKGELTFYECLLSNVSVVWGVFNDDLLRLAGEEGAIGDGRCDGGGVGAVGGDCGDCGDPRCDGAGQAQPSTGHCKGAAAPYYDVEQFKRIFLKYVSKNNQESDEEEDSQFSEAPSEDDACGEGKGEVEERGGLPNGGAIKGEPLPGDLKKSQKSKEAVCGKDKERSRKQRNEFSSSKEETHLEGEAAQKEAHKAAHKEAHKETHEAITADALSGSPLNKKLQTILLTNMRRTLDVLNKVVGSPPKEVQKEVPEEAPKEAPKEAPNYSKEHVRKLNYERRLYYEKYISERKKKNEMESKCDELRIELDRLEKKRTSLLFKLNSESVCNSILEEEDAVESSAKDPLSGGGCARGEESATVCGKCGSACAKCGFASYASGRSGDSAVKGPGGEETVGGGSALPSNSPIGPQSGDGPPGEDPAAACLLNFEKVITKEKILQSEPFRQLVKESTEVYKELKEREGEIALLKNEILKREQMRDEEYESLLNDTINDRKSLSSKIKSLEVEVMTSSMEREKMQKRVNLMEHEIKTMKGVEANQVMQLEQKEKEICRLRVSIDKLKASESTLRERITSLESGAVTGETTLNGACDELVAAPGADLHSELLVENKQLKRALEKKQNAEKELSVLKKNYDAMSEEIEEITKEFEKKQEQVDEMIIQIKNKEFESLEKYKNAMNKICVEENIQQLERSYQEKVSSINRLYEKYESFAHVYLTLFYYARRSAVLSDSAREEQMSLFIKMKDKCESIFQRKNELAEILQTVYGSNRKLMDKCNALYRENQHLERVATPTGGKGRRDPKDASCKGEAKRAGAEEDADEADEADQADQGEEELEERQLLIEENNELRRRLMCSVCMENFKNYIIVKCGHIYCESCIFSNLKTRNRKCPQCKIPFDKKDLQKIFLD